LTETLLKKYKQDITNLILVPSSGGKFEVSVNDKLIFSKKKEGRFPTNQEILDKLKA
jgi:selenoprotein W-related protein